MLLRSRPRFKKLRVDPLGAEAAQTRAATAATVIVHVDAAVVAAVAFTTAIRPLVVAGVEAAQFIECRQPFQICCLSPLIVLVTFCLATLSSEPSFDLRLSVLPSLSKITFACLAQSTISHLALLERGCIPTANTY